MFERLEKLDKKLYNLVVSRCQDKVSKIQRKQKRHIRFIYHYDVYGDWRNQPWYEEMPCDEYVSGLIVVALHMRYRAHLLLIRGWKNNAKDNAVDFFSKIGPLNYMAKLLFVLKVNYMIHKQMNRSEK